jgi:ATP-dependent Clp protease ATP-binding subunit ClpB
MMRSSTSGGDRSCGVPHPAAKALIARSARPVFGARPLKRMLQRRVETPISRMIIADQAPPRSHLTVDVSGDEFAISVS